MSKKDRFSHKRIKNLRSKIAAVVFSGAFVLGMLSFGVTGYCEDADADHNGASDTAYALSMKKEVKESLGPDDEIDVFKVVVQQSGLVMFKFTSSFRGPYFTIENEKESYITSQYVNGTDSEPEVYKVTRQLTAGTYYIKVTNSGSNTGSYSVYVTDQQPTGMKISQSSLLLEDSDNQSVTLKAEYIPEGSIEPEIEWSSGDNFVAAVNNGTVRANGIGYTTIVASAADQPSLKATCSVTVKPRKVATVTQLTEKTTKNKIAIICSMGYSAATMPDGYHYYLYDKKSGKFVRKGKSSKNEYTYKGLKEETGYKVKVCAYIKTPEGEIEGAMSDAKTLYTAPKQLKATTVTGIKKKNYTTMRGYRARVFNLKWKKVKGATSYKIYGQEQSGGKFKLMTTSKKPNVDLQAGVGFTYKVYVVPVRTKHGVSRDGKKSAKYTVDMRE